MTDFDLRNIPSDQLVIHFGGAPKQVDAFTFANSLIALSESIRELNTQVNPNHSIEIALDALGPGSFRAKIRTISKSIPGLFKGALLNVVLPLLLWYITDKLLSDDEINIIVGDEYYVVERGDDRIILPRNVYEYAAKIKNTEKLQRNISKTFEVLEDDKAIADLSFTVNMDDEVPIVTFPRKDFPKLAEPVAHRQPDENIRVEHERAELAIVRLFLRRSRRKWQFVYQGFQISAPVVDQRFYDKMDSREVVFGVGDLLDARIKIVREKDDETGVFVNDPNGYEIVEVHNVIPGPRQQSLLTE